MTEKKQVIPEPAQLSGAAGALGTTSLLNDKGLMAPNTLLGNTLGNHESVLTNTIKPNNGNVLMNLGENLSLLTSDEGSILGPLTGSQKGVLTSALLKQGTLLGDLAPADEPKDTKK